MKRITAALLLLSCIRLQAQHIPEENLNPVRIDQVKPWLSRNAIATQGAMLNEGKHIGEGPGYHDSRWLWYWQNHTDEQGRLISPLKTVHEWQSYRTKAAAKVTANQSEWTFTGPNASQGGYNGIGRINTVAFHPAEAFTYWIGSAGGGAWKTQDGGITWTPVADYLPVLSISDIDFNPLNPNTVYMCTGDRDARDHYSIGVLKSYDGGQSWNTTGLSWDYHQLRLANSLLVNPQDTNSLILATSEGIYRSFNGGAAFTLVQPGNFKQVLYHPADTNIVYATSFYTYANASDAQIFRSADGGSTWAQVTNFNDTWRIELAVTPADPAVVMAVAASRDTVYRRGLQGVYKSIDHGMSFSTVFAGSNCSMNILSGNMNGSGCTGQGNYDLCIAIHPQNPNKVYVGGVNTWTSDNGGMSWSLVNQWWGQLGGIAVVHADKHFLGYHPLFPGRLFECNDGGIYMCDNPVAWTDLTNGMGITQFYRNAVADAASYAVGGAQDNGSKLFDGTNWFDVTGGDGMECQIDPWNAQVYYTSIQYGGAIYRIDGFISNIADGPLNNLQGAWITPFLLHPADPNFLIVGYQDIYYGFAGNWTNLTNGALGTRNIHRLAMSPSNTDVLYAVPEDSQVIWRFNDFTNGIFTTIQVPYPERISDIKADPANADVIYVTFGGFGANKVAKYEFGGVWTLMNENLPNVPVNCIEIDSSNGYKYIGTDVAVFYRSDTMSQWQLYNNDLPAVHIMDLGINYATDEIWAATYGRGMWKSPRQTDAMHVGAMPEVVGLNIYPNPASGAFTVSLSEKLSGKRVSCTLMETTGRVLERRHVEVSPGGRLMMYRPGVAAGDYLLEISLDKELIGRGRVVMK